jgi:hypothetical protein
MQARREKCYAKKEMNNARTTTIKSDKIVQFCCVSKITPGLTADKNFSTGLLHFFQQDYFRTQLGSPSGGHHAAGTGTDYNYLIGRHISSKWFGKMIARFLGC